jgi:hypothetical protein
MKERPSTSPWRLILLVSLVSCAATSASTRVTGADDVSGLHQVPLRYIDANGKFVGRVLEGQGPYAVLRIGGDLVAVRLVAYDDGGTWDYMKGDFRFDSLIYKTPDCTGTPFRSSEAVLGIRMGTVVHLPGGGVGIYLAKNGVSTHVRHGSMKSPPNDQCDEIIPGDVTPLAVTPVDITGQFQPPFSVR